jgi:hypothetical protein
MMGAAEWLSSNSALVAIRNSYTKNWIRYGNI